MGEPRAYFDTSVLVRRYVHEEGSFQARLLSHKYLCVTSDLTTLEMVSGLIRRLRLGQLSERAVDTISARFNEDRRSWICVTINDSVLERAEQVVRSCRVKTLDAIHIATALQFQVKTTDRILFLSVDEKQLDAAAACGLRIENGLRR